MLRNLVMEQLRYNSLNKRDIKSTDRINKNKSNNMQLPSKQV